jgi:endonuclease III
MNHSRIVERLKEKAEEHRRQTRVDVLAFTKDPVTDRLLSDIDTLPHLFLLGCLADQQMKAERAWEVPVKLGKIIEGYQFADYLKLSQDDLKNVFEEHKLHRFTEKMAKWYFAAIQRIASEYEGDASKIWSGTPSSASIVRRFLRFEGMGIKIATMGTNMLARHFHVPMRDYVAIEISPDTHAKRVFYRLGITHDKNDNLDLIYAAKELNPEYPGLFDLPAWMLGESWCRDDKPMCELCYMNDLCPKVGVDK